MALSQQQIVWGLIILGVFWLLVVRRRREGMDGNGKKAVEKTQTSTEAPTCVNSMAPDASSTMMGAASGMALQGTPLNQENNMLLSSCPAASGAMLGTALLPLQSAQDAADQNFAPVQISGQQFLEPQTQIGLDTIGTSLKNGNTQLRSDPYIPQINVGPWNNSTIAPDLQEREFEIGSVCMDTYNQALNLPNGANPYATFQGTSTQNGVAPSMA